MYINNINIFTFCKTCHQKQIDVIIRKYDKNKLVIFLEIHKILKNRFGDSALKKSKVFQVLKELKENNVSKINAKSSEKIDSNVAITFKSNIFSNEYPMIVTGLSSERSKGSVIFVENNSSNNMRQKIFYCSSCRNVGDKMKPPKTLRTAIKVIDGKIVFQNEHVDGCENISFVKCFFLSLQILMSSSLTPTECWREYLYKITILCNNNSLKYEDFIKHIDFTDRETFINSINKKRNNCKAVLDLELTFYNNESYVFHGDGFIFCCSDFFFKMLFDKNIWCIDSTFSTSPRIYAQVLEIHVPLSVKKSVAMKEIFLESKFEYRSCSFHYKQSINKAYRRFKYDHSLDIKRRMSLRTTLEKKKDINFALRLLKQLSHLRIDDVREFYIERIFSIFKKYSMNDLDFYICTECIYNERIKTSNICEIRHAAIRRSGACRKKPRFNAFFLSVKKYDLDCFTTCIQYKDHECDDDKDFIKLFEYDDTMAGKESFLLQFLRQEIKFKAAGRDNIKTEQLIETTQREEAN
uniref:DNA-directed DNA polymerase n=1 Tax=Strongyloides venezuelensis TaxID=75913 RepID=A0A0K0FQX3_STRVS